MCHFCVGRCGLCDCISLKTHFPGQRRRQPQMSERCWCAVARVCWDFTTVLTVRRAAPPSWQQKWVNGIARANGRRECKEIMGKKATLVSDSVWSCWAMKSRSVCLEKARGFVPFATGCLDVASGQLLCASKHNLLIYLNARASLAL